MAAGRVFSYQPVQPRSNKVVAVVGRRGFAAAVHGRSIRMPWTAISVSCCLLASAHCFTAVRSVAAGGWQAAERQDRASWGTSAQVIPSRTSTSSTVLAAASLMPGLPQTCENDFDCNGGNANFPLQCLDLVVTKICIDPSDFQPGGTSRDVAYVPLPVRIDDEQR